MPLTNHHLLAKGDDMAVSKHTRRSSADSNQLFQIFFQNSQTSNQLERTWYDIVSLAGSSPLLLIQFSTILRLIVLGGRHEQET
jgi:hypothetical protein